MGAEGGGRRRVLSVGVSVGCGAVVLAGCASMPDSGDLRGVESTPRQDAQVRVFAMPPREDAGPAEIVQGFLEALTSDDPRYETARKYLTDGASRGWNPDASTTVLSDGPNTVPDHTRSQEAGDDYTYTLTGSKLAVVDAQHAYAPDSGTYSRSVHLTLEKKTNQWRIDSLPQGVVMGRSDFQRNYVSVNKYYYAANMPAAAGGQLSTVADPVYVRGKVDPVTSTVRSLLSGPTRWLDPVATSSFPSGTALRKDVTTLQPDDQNKLTVPLNDRANRVGQAQCARMAAQLLFTLQDLTPTGVNKVELQRSDGRQLCELNEDRAETIALHGTGRRAETEYEYFIDGKQRLVRLPSGSGSQVPTPVPGALGEGDKKLRAAAVSRAEDSAAGVSADGQYLYVGSLVPGASLAGPVVTSRGATQGDRLTTPSWDGAGDLWVADRDPKHARLVMLQKGAGQPVDVRTPGLDGRIDAVRVAADGVRIALIVEKGGKTSLQIGRVERENGADGRLAVSILELHSVTPQLEEVTAMSWAGDSRLVMVGREAGGVQQMRFVQVDGSTPAGNPPASLTGVKQIAASEDERLPLVAYSEDGIVRLSAGAQWQKVVKEGTAPVYPG
ncbi:lipoprotein LpqB [Streptomyces hygroscopicus]|uniref:LpqB family beta-propeller domain-containing protein n=1 Tax=Streptomyces hygroscopicus TaxID=1912 RepID=UPI003A103866|nr:lipoprotein LpqB [Streptomyces hygroscopicus]